MPRIRTLKPQFWDSPSTAKADLACRLLYMAMWNWADDAGRGTANMKELEAFAFPNDDVSTLPRRSSRNSAAVWPNFAELFFETVRAYEVTLYEVGGRRYYEISQFRVHQSKHFNPDSKLPAPEDGTEWAPISSNRVDREPTEDASAEVRGGSSRNSAISCRDLPLDRDRDRDRDRDVVYDDRAREHPDDPGPQEPQYVETAARPTKRHPTSAAKTVVRQELGNAGYPRTTTDRLAVQIDKLAPDHPDTLIRQALREWDQRGDSPKPEFLPTILGDIVKRQRATTTGNNRPPHKMRTLVELTREVEAQEQAQLATTTPTKELT